MITHNSKELENSVAAGLDFILSHFKEPIIWPRTISSKATEGRQVPVYSKQEALSWYKAANFFDCRISAYPHHSCSTDPNINRRNRHTIDLIMIDLDQSPFKSRQALDRTLSKLLRNIKESFGNEFEPSIIYSGNGYHIYILMEARYVLEDRPEFSKFEEPSKQFLRFAEWYLSDGKADSNHYRNVSFGNCMLRIPGSYNFKCVSKNNNVADSSTQVRIIKQCYGKTRAPIYLLFGSFLAYLVDRSLEEEAGKRGRQKQFSNNNNRSLRTIPWIEKLLKIPLEDYRKNAVGLIFAPYLITIRKLSYEESFTIIKGWLDKCDTGKRRLDFNPNYHIRYNLRYAKSKGSRPLRLETLKEKNRELYDILVR